MYSCTQLDEEHSEWNWTMADVISSALSEENTAALQAEAFVAEEDFLTFKLHFLRNHHLLSTSLWLPGVTQTAHRGRNRNHSSLFPNNSMRSLQAEVLAGPEHGHEYRKHPHSIWVIQAKCPHENRKVTYSQNDRRELEDVFSNLNTRKAILPLFSRSSNELNELEMFIFIGNSNELENSSTLSVGKWSCLPCGNEAKHR